ncbi:MAG TPA: hypothetical protein VFC25_06295 [Verrucomicrobiae bacterium]|nr:hypothetical protein [Verrucomicrobiae bacterium]
MQAEAGQFITGEELIARGRMVLELPSGIKVLIARLGRHEVVECTGNLVDVSNLAQDAEAGSKRGARGPDLKAIAEAERKLVLKAVIAPKLFADRSDGPTPDDFTQEELLLLLAAIVKLAGWTKEAGAEVLPLSKTDA